MNASFPLRAPAAWLLGIGLVLVGLFPVLYFVALVSWQVVTRLQDGVWVALPATLWFVDHSLLRGPIAGVLPFIPDYPSAWLVNPESWLPLHKAVLWALNRLHVGIVFAALGALVMGLGVLIAMRQAAVLAAARRARQDRLRRIREYRKGSAPAQPLASGESRSAENAESAGNGQASIRRAPGSKPRTSRVAAS